MKTVDLNVNPFAFNPTFYYLKDGRFTGHKSMIVFNMKVSKFSLRGFTYIRDVIIDLP